MFSSFVSAARHRRETVEQSLALLDRRQGDILVELDDATAALRVAAATVDALKAEEDDLSAQQTALRNTLRDLPSPFDPGLLQRMPVELLRAVFEGAVQPRHPQWTIPERDLYYDYYRATAPFHIASVCRRWRNIALGTPAIWTYISVARRTSSGSVRNLALYKPHIDGMLQRSKSCPIDVLLLWDSDYSTSHDGHLDHFRDIVDAVAHHMHRWSRVVLVLPEDTDLDGVDFLRNPTPLLEEIMVITVDNSSLPWHNLPNYLPQCPRLKRLCLSTIFIHPRSPLAALVEADIQISEQPPDVIWQTLKMMPVLEVLSIEYPVNNDGVPDPPTSHLCLPCLHTLQLIGFITPTASWATMLELPRINTLSIPSHFCGTLQAFLQTTFARITELVLGDDPLEPPETSDKQADVEAVEFFPALQHIHLRNVDVSELCDRLLAEDGSAAWPHLKRITLEGATFSPPAAERFIEYVKVKIAAASNAATDAASSLVFSVGIAGESQPAWLKTQLRAVLGDNLTLEDSDNED